MFRDAFFARYSLIGIFVCVSVWVRREKTLTTTSFIRNLLSNLLDSGHEIASLIRMMLQKQCIHLGIKSVRLIWNSKYWTLIKFEKKNAFFVDRFAFDIRRFWRKSSKITTYEIWNHTKSIRIKVIYWLYRPVSKSYKKNFSFKT